MKQFIRQYPWELLAITTAILASILFAIGKEWLTVVWSLLAGWYAGLFFRERYYFKRLEKEFKEYIISHKGG